MPQGSISGPLLSRLWIEFLRSLLLISMEKRTEKLLGWAGRVRPINSKWKNHLKIKHKFHCSFFVWRKLLSESEKRSTNAHLKLALISNKKHSSYLKEHDSEIEIHLNQVLKKFFKRLILIYVSIYKAFTKNPTGHLENFKKPSLSTYVARKDHRQLKNSRRNRNWYLTKIFSQRLTKYTSETFGGWISVLLT